MNNGNKNIVVITIMFFLGFFISKYFHFPFFEKNFMKKLKFLFFSKITQVYFRKTIVVTAQV